jgi:hypothetical protein
VDEVGVGGRGGEGCVCAEGVRQGWCLCVCRSLGRGGGCGVSVLGVGAGVVAVGVGCAGGVGARGLAGRLPSHHEGDRKDAWSVGMADNQSMRL